MNAHILGTIQILEAKIADLTSMVAQLRRIGGEESPAPIVPQETTLSDNYVKTKRRPSARRTAMRRAPKRRAKAAPADGLAGPSADAGVERKRGGRHETTAAMRAIVTSIAGEFDWAIASEKLMQAGFFVRRNFLNNCVTVGILESAGRGIFKVKGGKIVPPLGITPSSATHFDPADIKGVSPLDNAAINIGRALPDPFTLEQLQAKVGTKAGAYWIARWRDIGWLDAGEPGVYGRTRKFGEQP